MSAAELFWSFVGVAAVLTSPWWLHWLGWHLGGGREIYEERERRQRAEDEARAWRRHQGKEGEPPSYRCPHCGMVSWNLRDVSERYCGACHRYEDEAFPGGPPRTEGGETP